MLRLHIRPRGKLRHVRLHRWLWAKTASLLAELSSVGLRLLPDRSLTRIAAVELCSSFRYIAAQCRRGSVFPMSAGPAFEEDLAGHLVPNRRTQDRIRYTQKLLSEQPWISPANLQLFLLGWDAAEEWRDRSDTADRRELVQAWRTDYTPTAPSNSVMLQTRSADARRKIRELEAAIRTLEANKERGEPWPDGVISAGVASD